MGKKKKIEDREIGPAPTLNELKLEMERRLEKTDLDYGPSFFLNLFDPHRPEDAPQVVSDKNGNRFWKWQYRTHTLYLLGKFIKQKKVFQNFVIERSEEHTSELHHTDISRMPSSA